MPDLHAALPGGWRNTCSCFRAVRSVCSRLLSFTAPIPVSRSVPMVISKLILKISIDIDIWKIHIIQLILILISH
jgi:hypothetical protein